MRNSYYHIARLSKDLLRITLAFILLMVFNYINPGLAYHEDTTFKGGDLNGTVFWVGKATKPKKYNLSLYSDPYYCGRISDGKGWRLSPFVKVTSTKGVPGVIVYLETVQKGKPFSAQPQTVLTKDCQFSPYISLIKRGEVLAFTNMDPVQHKLEVYQYTDHGAKFIFRQDLRHHPDLRKSDFLLTGKEATHKSGPVISHEVTNQGPLVFRCSFHEYMEGWSVVMNHPYFSVADTNGNFSLEDIPPGTYKLIAWHPLGQTEQMVQVQPGKTQLIQIDFEPTPTITYPEAGSKPNPFGIDLAGDPHIVPTVELQKWVEW